MPAEVADCRPEPLVPRLESPDVLGEVIDLALLLIRVGRAVECVTAEGVFEESEESARPLQIGLVDQPGH